MAHVTFYFQVQSFYSQNKTATFRLSFTLKVISPFSFAPKIVQHCLKKILISLEIGGHVPSKIFCGLKRMQQLNVRTLNT